MANHVELCRCRGSVSSVLPKLEYLEAFCQLSVLAGQIFRSLFLLVHAYGCFGLAGCGWVLPAPSPQTLIVSRGH